MSETVEVPILSCTKTQARLVAGLCALATLGFFMWVFFNPSAEPSELELFQKVAEECDAFTMASKTAAIAALAGALNAPAPSNVVSYKPNPGAISVSLPYTEYAFNNSAAYGTPHEYTLRFNATSGLVTGKFEVPVLGATFSSPTETMVMFNATEDADFVYVWAEQVFASQYSRNIAGLFDVDTYPRAGPSVFPCNDLRRIHLYQLSKSTPFYLNDLTATYALRRVVEADAWKASFKNYWDWKTNKTGPITDAFGTLENVLDGRVQAFMATLLPAGDWDFEGQPTSFMQKRLDTIDEHYYALDVHCGRVHAVTD